MTNYESRRRPLDRVFEWYFNKFEPRPWEKYVHNALGVPIAKLIMPNNGRLVNALGRRVATKLDSIAPDNRISRFLETKTRRLNPDNIADLEDRIEKTKKGERDHLTIFQLLAIGITFAANHYLSFNTIDTFIAVESVMNGWPILLQRANRLEATTRRRELMQQEGTKRLDQETSSVMRQPGR